MNTTKIECPKYQVKRVSFQHGIAEFVRAQILRRIPTRKLGVYVRAQIRTDTYLRKKKTLVAIVEFQRGNDASKSAWMQAYANASVLACECKATYLWGVCVCEPDLA